MSVALQKLFLVCLVGLLANCSSQSANSADNLVLNKPYSISPKPNYKLCTDPQDIVQLTDGATKGSNWTKKTTVGWANPNEPIVISIDLQGIYGVHQINIYSIGGGIADVNYPELISLLVSSDGIEYETAGFISGRSQYKSIPGEQEKKSKIFTFPSINKNARFIKLVIRPQGIFFFTDEIEVLGSRTLIKADITHGNKYSKMEVSKVLEDMDRQMDFERDLMQVEEKIRLGDRLISPASRNSTRKSIASLKNGLSKMGNRHLPLKELKTYKGKVGLIRAEIFREFYNKPWVVLVANPMKVLRKNDLPLERSQGEAIRLQMWQGEYESAAVNIINSSDKQLTISATISRLRDSEGQDLKSDTTFTLRRAINIHAAGVGYIADALVLQKERPFKVKPGEVSQLWLTVHNPQLKPDKYKASLTVTETDDEGRIVASETIEISIEILNIQFPSLATLNTCVWAYPEQIEITRDIVAEAAEDLKRHYINAYVVHPSSLPWPSKGKINFEKFDQILAQNNYIRQYLLFINFQHQWTRDYFGRWLSQEWKEKFSKWLIELVRHMKTQGYGYDSYALYLWDEQLGDDFYTVAKLIKGIDPKIRLYANRFGKGPSDFMRFKELIDVWSPSITQREDHPNWLKTVEGFGKQIWTYDTEGPGRANEPYGYYRLLSWKAFQQKISGTGFWAYAEDKSYPSWNDGQKPNGYYDMIYGSARGMVDSLGEQLIPSRRWEAWREGVEDYEYLYQAQQKINALKNQDAEKASTFQSMLDDEVDKVLGRPNQPERIQQARKIISEILIGK